jgi:hypothetical protein
MTPWDQCNRIPRRPSHGAHRGIENELHAPGNGRSVIVEVKVVHRGRDILFLEEAMKDKEAKLMPPPPPRLAGPKAPTTK